MAAASLQPTLWRTCRVLANRTRLRIFGSLVRMPGQSVSTLARRMDLALPVASQYLRALEARGFLTGLRKGAWVKYHLSGAEAVRDAQLLRETLRSLFQRDRHAIDSTYKLVTAFTQPRRIEVLRRLTEQHQTLAELRRATGINGRSLLRHLQKLQARGFVLRQSGRPHVYAAAVPRNRFGRALARLAAGGK